MAWTALAQGWVNHLRRLRKVGESPMAPAERINLQVLCLTGEGLTLSILRASCSIWELEPSILSIDKIAISEPV
jgi:hypothetical protein